MRKKTEPEPVATSGRNAKSKIGSSFRMKTAEKLQLAAVALRSNSYYSVPEMNNIIMKLKKQLDLF